MAKDFGDILLEFQSVPKRRRFKTFMEISGFPGYENVCSNILQFYLNPYNEHSLADLVLTSLMSCVDDGFIFVNGSEKIEVLREVVTNKGNRLDLLITTERYVIGIENKIFHWLANDLSDYKNAIDSYCGGIRSPFYLVLTLNKLKDKFDIDKMAASNFINITYSQLFNNIRKNIGSYISDCNLHYLNYLTDFIKSIENLTPKTMEDKTLWTFFKNNASLIQELEDRFIDYKNELFHKVYLIQDIINRPDVAFLFEKQWIYQNNCLVHEYLIGMNNKILVDTLIDINGWSIELFARKNDPNSYRFLCDTMCKHKGFLPRPFDNYEKRLNEGIVYQRFDTDTDLSEVAQSLIDLLSRIEEFLRSY